jgi:NTE family protein
LSAATQRGAHSTLVLLECRDGSAGLPFALNLANSVAYHLQRDVALVDLSQPRKGSHPDAVPQFERHGKRLTWVRAAERPADALPALVDGLRHEYRFLLVWAPQQPGDPDPAVSLRSTADQRLLVIAHGAGVRPVDRTDRTDRTDPTDSSSPDTRHPRGPAQGSHPATGPRGGTADAERQYAAPPPGTLVVLGAPEPRSPSASEAIERATGSGTAVLLPEPPPALKSAGGQRGEGADWVLRNPNSPFAVGIGRLARKLVGKTVGLAFGSGAGRGHAHLGVLRALERLGIRADFVAGTSIGAFVAGMHAQNVSLHEMEMSIRALGGSIRKWAVPVYSLLSGAALERAVRKAVPPHLQIEDFYLPCVGVAADMETGEEVQLSHGSAWRSALACASIPGVFPPVRLDGRLLIDGGVVCPIPCRVARTMGADVVLGIALEIAPPDRRHPEPGEGGPNAECGMRNAEWGIGTGGRRSIRPHSASRIPHSASERGPTWPAVLLRSVDLLQQALTQECLKDADIPIRAFTPAISLTDFRGGPEFLEAGERAVAAVEEHLRALLPWVGS